MAQMICTHCGYEGRGTRIPKSGGTGLKILGAMLMLPIFTIVNMFKPKRSNTCPHCNMPTLVKLNSDAGRLMQQKIDIELGILKPKPVEEQRETFGAVQNAERVQKKPVDPDQW